MNMSGAIHSLRVSYGLISQAVIDLPLPARHASQGDDIVPLLLCSRTDGSLSLLSTEDADHCEQNDISNTILAELFRDPARLRTRVENVIVEAPPQPVGYNDLNTFPLPLHCFVLLTAGLVLDFKKYHVKVVLSHGTKAEPKAEAVTPPALKMEEGSERSQQREAVQEDEADKEEENAKISMNHDELIPSKSDPVLQLHEDSETESDEDIDETVRAVEAISPSALTAMTTMIEDAERSLSKQEEESQDGISSFLPAKQTPQKTYGKSRKCGPKLNHDHSTASTIPESVQNSPTRVSTSFVVTEAVARSLRMPSLPVGEHADVVALEEDVQSGGATEDMSSDGDEASKPEATPMPALRKRRLEAQREPGEEDADIRLFKAAKQDESSLDVIVTSEPNIKKLKKPSRPATQAISQPTRAQSTGKTPATPAPPSSSSRLSSVKAPKKVLLSGSRLSPGERGWLKRQTAIVDDVPGRKANFVCVVRDTDLPATFKVLRSLIANKPVVSDQWVTDSKENSELLDPSDYLHADLQGSDIKSNDRRLIWKRKTLFFTTSAAKSYKGEFDVVKLIAFEAGAAMVEHGNANKGGELMPDKANTILFGTDITKDLDAQTLLAEYGRTVYDTKLFSTAIIKADFDPDSDEFQLVLPGDGLTKTKQGRGK